MVTVRERFDKTIEINLKILNYRNQSEVMFKG